EEVAKLDQLLGLLPAQPNRPDPEPHALVTAPIPLSGRGRLPEARVRFKAGARFAERSLFERRCSPITRTSSQPDEFRRTLSPTASTATVHFSVALSAPDSVERGEGGAIIICPRPCICPRL